MEEFGVQTREPDKMKAAAGGVDAFEAIEAAVPLAESAPVPVAASRAPR
jgi:hypothetical protein